MQIAEWTAFLHQPLMKLSPKAMLILKPSIWTNLAFQSVPCPPTSQKSIKWLNNLHPKITEILIDSACSTFLVIFLLQHSMLNIKQKDLPSLSALPVPQDCLLLWRLSNGSNWIKLILWLLEVWRMFITRFVWIAVSDFKQWLQKTLKTRNRQVVHLIRKGLGLS